MPRVGREQSGTEVKETNENKDLNIVVCPRQCGSDGAEESGMGGVGS